MSSADLALQDTGARGAAEYGRLAVWAHYPPFSVLGVATTAAGRCISAGAPPRPSTLLVSIFFLFVTCHDAYPAFLLHDRFPPNLLFLFVSVHIIYSYSVHQKSRAAQRVLVLLLLQRKTYVSGTAGKNAVVQLLPLIYYTLLELRP